MVWDDTSSGAPIGRDEPIELVGTHLRLTGVIALGRFGRLTDLINASSGYVRVRDARLLRRNGDPTNLVLPELMVDQDEISFIAQTQVPAPERGEGVGYVEPRFRDRGRRPQATRICGLHAGSYRQRQDPRLRPDGPRGLRRRERPRFLAMTGVTARSLADRRIISHYDFILINRTQMIAASEVGRQGDIVPEDLPEL